jgi:hypothetical protein
VEWSQLLSKKHLDKFYMSINFQLHTKSDLMTSWKMSPITVQSTYVSGKIENTPSFISTLLTILHDKVTSHHLPPPPTTSHHFASPPTTSHLNSYCIYPCFLTLHFQCWKDREGLAQFSLKVFFIYLYFQFLIF